MYSPPHSTDYPEVSRTSTPTVTLENEILLAGFRDCHYEALMYLIEVEKLPLDDPLVVGLQHHLEAKEAELCQNPQGFTTPQDNDQDYMSYPNYTPSFLWPQHTDNGLSLPMSPFTMPYTELQPSYTSLQDDSTEHVDCSMNDSGISEICEMDSACDSEIQDILQTQEETIVDEQYLKNGAEYLDNLAQNNGKIGSLLNELFGLLEEEEADDTSSVDAMISQGAGLPEYSLLHC